MQHNQQGFILVTVVWMLALITIAASFFALWVERSLTLLQEQQQDIQAELDLYSTEATLLYLFSTQSYTLGGLTTPQPVSVASMAEIEAMFNDPAAFDDMLMGGDDTRQPRGTEISLDDRAHYGIGQARFAIQDESSLVNIGALLNDVLDNLLQLLGVAGGSRQPLIAKLVDYNDINDFHILNGAERSHYERAGLPPPRNRWPLHPLEVRRVLDWNQYPQLWQSGIWQQVTSVARVRQFNINAAPALVLQARYGINAQAAAQMLQARQQSQFYNLSDIAQRSGVILNIDPVEAHFMPSQTMRITLWHERAKYMRQLHVIFTPIMDQAAPWSIQYALQLPLSPIYANAAVADVKTTIFDPTILSTDP